MELRGKEKSVRAEIDAKEREKKSVEEEVKALEEKERTESEKKEEKKAVVKKEEKKAVVKKEEKKAVVKKEEESNVKESVEEIEKMLGCFVRLLSDDSFELLIKKREESKARIIIHMLSDQSVSIRVVLHPSITKSLRKRLEARLPIQTERIVEVKDMREMVCRYYWIVCHTC